MIETPIIPDELSSIPRFLRDYLGKIAAVLQTIADGQVYPSARGDSAKAQGWNDVLASFNAGKVVGVNAPTWSVLKNGLYAWQFSAATMNEIWLSPIHIDHTYKPGTPIYFHIHWTNPGVNTGVVRWGIEYSLQKGHSQGAFPATTTIYLEQAANATAYTHQIIEVANGSGVSTNIEPDTLILMRIFRDAAHANDTCTDAVFGLQTDCHYQVGYWGTKQKTPNFYL